MAAAAAADAVAAVAEGQWRRGRTTCRLQCFLCAHRLVGLLVRVREPHAAQQPFQSGDITGDITRPALGGAAAAAFGSG